MLLSAKSKTFLKLFFLVFFINLVILNWNDISWLFNRRTVVRGLESVVFEEPASEFHDRENVIEIPAIGISVPLVFPPDGASEEEIYNTLDKGVTHFPNSSLPGEEGVVILLGHSAPLGWPKIDHDWVFTEVQKLERGDKIKLYYNNQLFIYTVTEQTFFEIGEDVPSDINKKEIVLLSCWPPGKNIKRIGVRGVLTK